MSSFFSRPTRHSMFFAADDSAGGTLRGASHPKTVFVPANGNRSTQTSMNHSLTASSSAPGFVDFYQMLNQPADAPTIQLRSRINEVYAEAQANRDHRNPERRRQYATLLSWIPQARVVLLHEGRRAKYDAYAAQARLGQATQDFRAYLNELIGESDLDMGEGESILGLRNPTDAVPTPATARLSPRLDAIRAAAGEAAAKAATTSAATSDTTSAAPATNGTALQSAKSSPTAQNPVAARRPTRDEIVVGVGDGAANNTTSAARRSASRGAAKAQPQYALNPVLQQERASLLSSAIGAVSLLAVLLIARVMLPQAPLPLSVGIAVIAGFAVWRGVRRQMLRGVHSQH